MYNYTIIPRIQATPGILMLTLTLKSWEWPGYKEKWHTKTTLQMRLLQCHRHGGAFLEEENHRRNAINCLRIYIQFAVTLTIGGMWQPG